MTPTSQRTLIGVLAVLGIAALLFWTLRPAAPVDVVADTVARERAAALYAEKHYTRAREELRPLVERRNALAEDLIRAACVDLEPTIADTDRARELVERARGQAPDDPAVYWQLFRLAMYESDFEAALPHLRRVREMAPDSYSSRLTLANTLMELGQEEGGEAYWREAEEHYRALVATGGNFAGSWYRSAVFRLQTLLRQDGRDDEADPFAFEFARLGERGVTIPTGPDFDRGDFGSVRPPPKGVVPPRGTGALLASASWTPGGGRSTEELAGVLAIRSLPPRPVEQLGGIGYVHVHAPREPELLLWGPAGLLLARRGQTGAWRTESLIDEPVTCAAALDLGNEQGLNDSDLDVVAAVGTDLVLLEQVVVWPVKESDEEDEYARDPLEVEWRRREEPLLRCPSPPTDLTPVDFDHDGDVDLLVVGDFGVRLLRNDGVGAKDGGFTDATGEAGLPRARAFAWSAIEDLDDDQDVDLVLGERNGVFLASNERAGVFSDQSAELPAGLDGRSAPAIADLDTDGFPDLIDPWRPTRAFLGRRTGGYRTVELGGVAPEEASPSGAPVATFALADRPIVCWPDRVRGIDGPAGPVSTAGATAGAVALALHDLANDGVPDLLSGGPAGLVELAADPPSGVEVLRLTLQGRKDNALGLGAIVEVRAGPVYQRVYCRGETLLVGIGDRETADVVRITWPNGVIQHGIDLEAGVDYLIKQREGLQGSCPFLYTWNGATYELVSDVLGITPLGLPMGPGMLVPPDHDEYVLVRGRQLAPKDGFFELQLTEELREVTYLDRVRLDVVDHPADVEVQPNERFTFPPFPEHRVHTLRAPLAPVRATGSDGRDWTAELTRDDGAFATPFEPYTGVGAGQFLGLAPPHWIELEFDREAVAGAEELRLAMTGWFYWTDASVNMAAARHPNFEFVPPIAQVPDGSGGWRSIEPPLGFPAGKTKTMVVDASFLDRDDPRLRVFSTLRLYWDSVRLAVDGDDAPYAVTPLEPSSAELWRRGYSRQVPYRGNEELAWFEWDELEEQPRWNQHPGLYTRYGEVVPLLGEIDDRFVIMGSGDALTVRFPAGGLPPLKEGWTRDYLVFLDGWAKDRDPNTHEARFVEPLPFHGMSGYPYGPDEAFPDDEEHRRWRREWNTRPAHRWIESLVPPRSP